MNIHKKILLVLVIFTLMLCLGGVASAEGDFLMRIDTVSVPEGYDGEVIVPVYIDSMPDGMELSCFAWEFYFDSDNLSFITSDDPAAYAGELIVNPDDCAIGKIPRIDGSQGKFRFGWTSPTDYITQTGEALHLNFYVHGAMTPGVYNIVADPFSDIRSGTESVIFTDDLLVDINSYITFGAIVIEGESDYNDYEVVASKAKYLTYVPEEGSVSSGIVDEVDGVPVDKENNTVTPDTNTSSESTSTSTSTGSSNVTSGNSSGTGTLVSSTYKSQHTNDYTNDVKTIADSYDAGTMINFASGHIVFDTIKSQSGWLVCLLYKGEELVGYDISWANAGEKMSANIEYSDIPDTAVSVIMRGDGTFDCYGKYPIYKN